LNLQLLTGRFAVCRLNPDQAIPDWPPGGGEFVSVTRTSDELSVVCSESAIPIGSKCERGWRALKVAGLLDFSLTGILVSIAKPLADVGVSIFAVSTYETDYVLVKEGSLEKALQTLSAAGHMVKRG